jgi:hypothetical protein
MSLEEPVDLQQHKYERKVKPIFLAWPTLVEVVFVPFCSGRIQSPYAQQPKLIRSKSDPGSLPSRNFAVGLLEGLSPMISTQEAGRKKRPQWQPPPIDAGRVPTHPDKLLSFAEWSYLNGFSPRTGRRICAAGDGPPIVRLSKQKIGIRVADNARWQASRARKRK